MIDLHNHLLPGIDDGPRTLADSLAMARLAVAAGITRMVCTPHVLPDAAPTPQQIAQAVAALRGELDAAGIALQIDTGAEIAVDVAFELDDDALRGYSLGGGGVWVLLEMPFEGWPLRLPQFLADLEMRGFRAVLAHPERARSVQLSVDRLRDLVGRGALTQITAEAVTGEFGPLTRQVARTLVTNGLAHLIASDAHSPTRRPPGLYPALEQAARWMRAHVPGIHIPDAVIDRMEKAEKPAAEGKKICIELIQQIRAIAGVSGVHIMAYRREHLVAEIVREAGISRD